MGRRYFEWSALAIALVQLGAVACSRSDRDRRHEERSGIVSPRVGELSRRPAIGGGPKSAEDGGIAMPEFGDLDPGASSLDAFDSGTTGMTSTTGTGTTGSDTTGTGTTTTGTTGTTGTGTGTGTGTTGTGTTGTGTTGTGTTGTMSTTGTGAGQRI